MNTPRILISGAGIAGATLAQRLGTHGLDVTILERAQQERSSGNPVDVRGQALDVVESMGIGTRLRAAATTASRTVLVSGDGTPIGRLASQNAAQRSDALPEIEIPRADLASILSTAAQEKAELRNDVTIETVDQDRGGVDVRLSTGEEERFDVLIGADGVHSQTRSQAFDRTAWRRSHLGLYIATFRVPALTTPAEEVQLFAAAGRLVSVHPGRGEPLVAFIFRSRELAGHDHRDLDAHKAVIHERFRGLGWRVPEILEQLRASHDVFFDSVARVHMRTWSRGRVALVGDAASCVSLLGNGSSKAIIGADSLARHLMETSDHQVAFRRYQEEHRRRIVSTPTVLAISRFLVPGSAPGVWLRNQAIRAMNARAMKVAAPEHAAQW